MGEEDDKSLDTLPPLAKSALVREFGQISRTLTSIQNRLVRIETQHRERAMQLRMHEKRLADLQDRVSDNVEETGRHRTADLEAQVRKFEDDDTWRRRAVLGAIITIAVAAIIAAGKLVFG